MKNILFLLILDISSVKRMLILNRIAISLTLKFISKGP
jgi:hypothetical protein